MDTNRAIITKAAEILRMSSVTKVTVWDHKSCHVMPKQLSFSVPTLTHISVKLCQVKHWA